METDAVSRIEVVIKPGETVESDKEEQIVMKDRSILETSENIKQQPDYSLETYNYVD